MHHPRPSELAVRRAAGAFNTHVSHAQQGSRGAGEQGSYYSTARTIRAVLSVGGWMGRELPSSLSSASSTIAAHAVDPTHSAGHTYPRPGLRCIQEKSRYALRPAILHNTVLYCTRIHLQLHHQSEPPRTKSIPPIPLPGARAERCCRDSEVLPSRLIFPLAGVLSAG